jgi:hypothetical protein
MIARASGFGIRVRRFSRSVRGPSVGAMLHTGLDTTRRVEFACNVLQGQVRLPLATDLSDGRQLHTKASEYRLGV